MNKVYALFLVCCVAGMLGVGSVGHADEDSVDRDYSKELPRIPGSTPGEALEQFSIVPGYRIELVAAEPLVIDPIAMAFDEQGRLFVVEMRGYSEMRDTNTGRIRMLTDTDGDGKYDTADTYVDGLAWPTAVACYDGGVFVAVAPELRYYKDTDGDGKADIAETIYTGFGLSNVQGLVNTLKWNLDNRLHGATSSSGAELRPATQPDAPVLSLKGRDFSFDPNSMGDMRAESGGAQHGLSFDPWGNKFVCSNSDHIQQVMYEDGDIALNPFFEAPNARVSIAADGPAAEVYRTSPVEPWRVVRTRLRIKKLVPGPVEGGGRAAGYFTGSTGVTIYKGDAMPELYGQAFVGDVGGNLVHRKSVDRSGLVFVADRVEQNREFLSSSDIWFRPCQFTNGPEGALYIADMCREVIEHPASLPPMIKKHLDLNSGNDKGRIWRIVPENFEQPAIPNLGTEPSGALVGYLDHDNSWHRETASRLLYERQDKAVVPALADLATAGSRAEGRIRARYVLDTLNALESAHLVSGVQDGDAHVRRHALKLVEPGHAVNDALVEAMASELHQDKAVQVRYETIFASNYLTDSDVRGAILAEAFLDAPEDRWMQNAVLAASHGAEGDTLKHLLGDATKRAQVQQHGQNFLRTLARQTGQGKSAKHIAAALAALEQLEEQDSKLARRCIQALQQGYKASGGKNLAALTAGASIDDVLAAVLAESIATLEREDASLPAQVAAVRALEGAAYVDIQPYLATALTTSAQPTLQTAALHVLRSTRNDDVAKQILTAWSNFSPQVQSIALDVLFSSTDWTRALLQQIDEGTLSHSVLDSTRLDVLAHHKDKKIQSLAQQIASSRQTLSEEKLGELSKAILALEGDPKNGQVLFQENCMSCHKLGSDGYDLGPSLATVGQGGREKILSNILAPNMEVNPQYFNFIVETKDWESYSGVITAESATSITLQRANGESDTILRINIDSIRSTGRTIMPEDWEQGLGNQGLADLVAFLSALQ